MNNLKHCISLGSLGLIILLLLSWIACLILSPENEGFTTSEFANDGVVILGDQTGSKLSTLSIYDIAYPSGTILLWNDSDSDSSSAPPGWVLCDGKNNTPDMSNRFPFGWDINNPSRGHGGTGNEEGKEWVQLTISEMPPHSHTLQLHTKQESNLCDRQTSTYNPPDIWDWTTLTTSEKGGDESHPNMPPFRVMKFIMKL
jgi:hypothetical protein